VFGEAGDVDAEIGSAGAVDLDGELRLRRVDLSRGCWKRESFWPSRR
jgi:hypothetical protein